MATAPYQTFSKPQYHALVERCVFTGMALATIAISMIGFLPSIIHSAARRFRRSPASTESYFSPGFSYFWSEADSSQPIASRFTSALA